MKKVRSEKSTGYLIFCIVLAVLLAAISAFAVWELFRLGVLDMKQNMIFAGIIAALVILILLFLFLFRKSKAGRIVMSILTCLSIALMGMGSFYLYKTSDTLGKVTVTDSTTQNTIEAVVMQSSPIQNETGLQGASVGILKTIARNDTVETLNRLTAAGVSVTPVEFDSIKDLAGALYDNKVAAIILPQAYRGQLSDSENERYRSFDSDTRVVYSTQIEKVTSNGAKKVDDVTMTPFTVLISGVDSRNGFAEVSRSDVNMLATVNPQTHEVLLTSIPRDYYVRTACDPSYGCQNGALDKLTHTGLHDTETTKKTIEELFGITINYTMKVNFTSVVNLVNALGGIDVTVEPGYAVESFWTAPEYGVHEGVNHLNGDQALAFARERYAYQEGDHQRVKNQQTVLMAVAKKALSPAIITSYPSLMDALSGAFMTDMDENEIKSLIQNQMATGADWTFMTYSVSGTGSTQFCAELGNNAYVMIPDYGTVATAKAKIQAVLDGRSPEEVEAATGNAADVPNQVGDLAAQTAPESAPVSNEQPVETPAVDSAADDSAAVTDPAYTDPAYTDPAYPDPNEQPLY